MFAILHSLAIFVIDFFKSPRRLEAENLFLRHQLSIALRRAPPRLRLRGSDRALTITEAFPWASAPVSLLKNELNAKQERAASPSHSARRS